MFGLLVQIFLLLLLFSCLVYPHKAPGRAEGKQSRREKGSPAVSSHRTSKIIRGWRENRIRSRSRGRQTPSAAPPADPPLPPLLWKLYDPPTALQREDDTLSVHLQEEPLTFLRLICTSFLSLFFFCSSSNRVYVCVAASPVR